MPITIKHGSGHAFAIGGFGIDWKIDGAASNGKFAVVHHSLAPHALAAPLHCHHREDEYSYVLTGRLGALLGGEVVVAEPGTWVLKPREQWHTFWNAGNEPCEIIEVISPAGFEDYFRELAALWPDQTRIPELLRKYDLDIDLGTIARLCAQYGLVST